MTAAKINKPGLTPKQRKFIRWYLSEEVSQNGAEAARRAGYKGNSGTLRQIAHENLKKPPIAEAIAEGLERALKGAEISVESVLKRLARVGEEAYNDRNWPAAIRACELQGKYLKMFTDRVEHVQSIEDMPLAELKRIAKEVMEKGNLDLKELLAGDEAGDGPRAVAPGDSTTH